MLPKSHISHQLSPQGFLFHLGHGTTLVTGFQGSSPLFCMLSPDVLCINSIKDTLNTELHCVVKLVTSNVCVAQGCEQNSLYSVPYLLCTLECLNFWWPCSARWRFWLDSSSKSFHGLLFPENVSHLSLIHSTMGSFIILILRTTFCVLTTCPVRASHFVYRCK